MTASAMIDNQPVSDKRILIVDPDPARRDVAVRFLSSEFRVESADSTDQALAMVYALQEQGHPYDLALCAISAKPLGGARFASSLRDVTPSTTVALLTAKPVDPQLTQMRRCRVHNVIISEKPFNFFEFHLMVENLLYPERAFGLRRYLREPRTVVDGTIRALGDIEPIIQRVQDFARKYRRYESDVMEVRLASEELINNALFHAFHKSNGTEKYAAGRFQTLETHEHVLVSHGRDPEFLGIAVRDNQGTLDPASIMDKLERHYSLTGIMDLGGRGFYLTRQLCDRMIVNIDPGVATEVILLFASDNRPPGPKPILINEVSGR